jgi:hypothetical protein
MDSKTENITYLEYVAYGHNEKPKMLSAEGVANLVGPGWKQIVLDLCDELRTKHNWDGNLYQIKEKFGGLRFYAGGFDPEGRAAIDKAENLSYTVCDVCGDPGVPRGGGWVRTLCNLHAEGRKQFEWSR